MRQGGQQQPNPQARGNIQESWPEREEQEANPARMPVNPQKDQGVPDN